MRIAAIYARVSSEAQAQQATIDSQLSLLRARIEGDGYQVGPALCFVDDGVSGTTLGFVIADGRMVAVLKEYFGSWTPASTSVVRLMPNTSVDALRK